MHAQLIAAPIAVRRPLTETDAVDIWIARWLRIRRKDLLIRYGCDPRRLYEIWEEARFPGARAQAEERSREVAEADQRLAAAEHRHDAVQDAYSGEARRAARRL